METRYKIFITGSLHQRERILYWYNAYKDEGEVFLLKGTTSNIQYESRLELCQESIKHILAADEIIFVRKPDGTLGESCTFKLALAMELKKKIQLVD